MSQQNIRLTLRTLLAYMDDTLEPTQALIIGQKLTESPHAQELAERIRKIIRKRTLGTPSPSTEKNNPANANQVAAYLSDALTPEQVTDFETICLDSDVHLAEVAACHQILTLLLSEPVRVPPTSFRRMYGLVKGRESQANREPRLAQTVGGAIKEKNAADADDAEIAYFLGMSANAQKSPWRQRAVIGGIVGVLLLGFVAVVWVIVSSSFNKHGEVVKHDNGESTKPIAITATPTTRPTSETPPVTQPTPTTMVTPPPVTKPTPPTTVPTIPPKEVIPAVPNLDIKPGRIGVATFDGGETPVLLGAQVGEVDEWKPIPNKAELFTSDKLMCLPGYRVTVKYPTGFSLELWGNMPELVPVNVLQTSITPVIQEEGFDADFVVHVGRVYLNATKMTGAKARVRFRKEVWDVTLADNKSEVVIEVMRGQPLGSQKEPPITTAILHVQSGSATVDTHRGQPIAVTVKQILYWRNDTTKVEGPKIPDAAKGEPDGRYFDRLPIYPNEASAVPSRKALESFSKRLPESAGVMALLGEFHSAAGTTNGAESVYGARFALFSSAALNDYSRLADAILDPTNRFIREAGIIGVRLALASEQGAEEKIRKVAENKLRLEPKELDAWMTLLYGYSVRDRSEPEMLDRLVNGLSAREIVQRELALFVLLEIDPTSRTNKVLASFDANGSQLSRDTAIKAWKARIAELKSKIEK